MSLAAQETIREQTPQAKLSLMTLDLADLASIKRFADTFLTRFSRLDVLMNNAGLMAIPQRTTADGFEMQIGTNHLGHFALTAQLIARLMDTPNSRVVTVTSLAANTGRIRINDLMSQQRYGRGSAYGQSKLSNMLFGIELQRRLTRAGSKTISLLAHPGFSATNLQQGPADNGGVSGKLLSLMLKPLCQSQDRGALPQLHAAMQPHVQGGSYFGPSGPMEMRGHATEVRLPRVAKNASLAEKLWDQSVALTGESFLPL